MHAYIKEGISGSTFVHELRSSNMNAETASLSNETASLGGETTSMSDGQFKLERPRFELERRRFELERRARLICERIRNAEAVVQVFVLLSKRLRS